MNFSDLIPSSISNLFQPSKKEAGDQFSKYIENQQGGCGIAHYPQGNRSTRKLFWEVLACNVDSTITDVGGSFSFTLAPTEAWDEVILPDDYVRIFMGDQIASIGGLGGQYNFGDKVDLSKSGRTDVVAVPLPQSEWKYSDSTVSYGQQKAIPSLIMFEKMLGKVDRVERVESPGDAQGGPKVTFQVSGRSFGAIIQDISLYYNEFIPGLNAYNQFAKSQTTFQTDPTNFVRQFLSISMTSVPLPQWNLPLSLINDLKYQTVAQDNAELTRKTLGGFVKTIQSINADKFPGAAEILKKIQSVAKDIEGGQGGNQSPFQVLSLKSMQKTLGEALNTQMLNSTTVGLYDLLKQLSNIAWNEFYFDLCPGGNITGSLLADVAVPSVVMRQRPYNISQEMLKGLADSYEEGAEKYDKFPEEDLGDIGKSLFELDSSSIYVFGSVQDPNVASLTLGLGDLPEQVKARQGFVPMSFNVNVGRSNNDRVNGFSVLPQGLFGNEDYIKKAVLASAGAYNFDVDSIVKYGFRMMELGTAFAGGKHPKTESQNRFEIAVSFNKLIQNWYFLNPFFYNGKITTKFMPEARLGVPLKYFATRTTPSNPFPRMDLFYVQGVGHSYQYGQMLTTTYTVTRGLRYNLSKRTKDSSLLESKSINSRVRSFISSIGSLV